MRKILSALALCTLLNSCTWVLDLTTGQTLEQYISTESKTIRIVEERDFVEGCLIDTVLNINQAYYTVEIVHFNTRPCEQLINYYMYGLNAENGQVLITSSSLQGATSLSWFLPIEFDNFTIYGGINNEQNFVARIRNIDALQ